MINWKKIKNNTKKNIIGIIGCESGVGVTHLSLMLGNYAASKLKTKTAIVEYSGNNDFAKIQEMFEGKSVNYDTFDCYKIFNLVYYRNVDHEMLAQIKNMNFDNIIIDFGNDYNSKRNELLLCNTKVVVGSLCEWKRPGYMQKMNQILSDTGSHKWRYLALFANDKMLDNFMRTYKVNINSIPFEPDPFMIHSNNFNILETIISY